MGCNCKKKTSTTNSTAKITNVIDNVSYSFTNQEVIDAVYLINSKIHHTYDEISLLFDLHNRIFPKAKQLNINCSDCVRTVKKNIIRYYEETIQGTVVKR